VEFEMSLGFRDLGSEFKVQCLKFEVQGLRFEVQGSKFQVSSFKFACEWACFVYWIGVFACEWALIFGERGVVAFYGGSFFD
jgi:hypothetical protein